MANLTDVLYPLPPKTCEGPVFFSPSGDKIREFFQWDPSMTKLEKVGEEDIQEAMNERAKGQTITEQVARLARGDNSVFKDGEGLYADVYEYPEMRGEALKKGAEYLENMKTLQEKEKADKEKSLQDKMAALQKEIDAFKAKESGEKAAEKGAEK